MLVLTRRRGESIAVADNIEIVVVEVRRGKVRLGLRAPIDIPIHRGEIHDRQPQNAPSIAEHMGAGMCDGEPV